MSFGSSVASILPHGESIGFVQRIFFVEFSKRGEWWVPFFFLKWDDHLNGIINGFSWGYFNLYTYRGYNPITTGRAGRGPPCRYAGGTFIGESDLCRQCRW